jgi:hypothetical protein
MALTRKAGPWVRTLTRLDLQHPLKASSSNTEHSLIWINSDARFFSRLAEARHLQLSHRDHERKTGSLRVQYLSPKAISAPIELEFGSSSLFWWNFAAPTGSAPLEMTGATRAFWAHAGERKAGRTKKRSVDQTLRIASLILSLAPLNTRGLSQESLGLK